ncbi:hypothetical protein [Nostoc sp.]|uniref:hypothetical protein n=1 Tax=Nostoc sp. TaxID=1180 RepID=UPI002FFBF319
MSNAVYDINAADLYDKKKLPDGDIISISVVGPDESSKEIKFILRLEEPVSWWKGLLLFNRKGNNSFRAIAELQGNDPSQTNGATDIDELGKYDLVLSKAKTFGVHTNMYRIVDAQRAFRPGYQYILSWLTD